MTTPEYVFQLERTRQLHGFITGVEPEVVTPAMEKKAVIAISHILDTYEEAAKFAEAESIQKRMANVRNALARRAYLMLYVEGAEDVSLRVDMKRNGWGLHQSVDSVARRCVRKYWEFSELPRVDNVEKRKIQASSDYYVISV